MARRVRRTPAAPRRWPRPSPAAVATGALILTIVVAPEVLGGTFGWGITIIAAMAAMTAIATAVATGADLDARPRTVWLGVALLGWTALQASPLPRALVEVVQPLAVRVTDDAAALLETPPPSWIALSLSPHDTWTEVVKLAAMLAAFLSAISLSTRSWRRPILIGAAGSVLLMALVALCHLAADADSIFGLYEPKHAARILLAPLINRNHLAGFLAMGVPLMLGLALDAPSPTRRNLWFAAAVVTGTTVMLAASRGGIASLLSGVAVLALLGLVPRGSRTVRRAPFLWLGAAGTTVAGVGLYVASESLFRDFERGDLSKLDLAGAGLGLALDHPWVGVGRGAFSSALVADHGVQYRYTHPENWLAQWSSEWGLIVTAGLVVVIASVGLRAMYKSRSWSRAGALAAIASILIHDLVDFALERIGVAIVAAAIAGAAVAPRQRRVKPEGARLRSRVTLSAVAAVTIAGVCFHAWRIDHTSRQALQTRLEEALVEQDHDRFARTLDDAVRRHPAEPAFFLLGGAEAVSRDDPSALAWLNQAMRAAEGWAAPHAEAARFLARRGAFGQAFGEIREAEARQTGSAVSIACDVLPARPAALDAFLRVIRSDEVGLGIMDRVADCLPPRSEVALSLDSHLVEQGVDGARRRAAVRALVDDRPSEALAHLATLDASDEEIAILIARAHLEAGSPEQAAVVLRGASNPSTRRLRLLAAAEARAGEVEAMRATLTQLRGRAAGRASGVAEAWILQGRLERSMRNDGAAMRAFERAHRIDPSSEATGEIATLAETLGDRGRAFRAHAELCQREGPSSSHCEARDRLRRPSPERPVLPPQPTGTP